MLTGVQPASRARHVHVGVSILCRLHVGDAETVRQSLSMVRLQSKFYR